MVYKDDFAEGVLSLWGFLFWGSWLFWVFERGLRLFLRVSLAALELSRTEISLRLKGLCHHCPAKVLFDQKQIEKILVYRMECTG